MSAVAFNVCFILYAILYLVRNRQSQSGQPFVIRFASLWAWALGNLVEGTIVGALFSEYGATIPCYFGECFVPGCTGYTERATVFVAVWPTVAVLFVILRWFIPDLIPGIVAQGWEQQMDTYTRGRRGGGVGTAPSFARPQFDDKVSVPLMNLH